MSSVLTNMFDNNLVFGETYEIENFAVIDFKTKYKCVEGDSHIMFTDITTTNRIPPLHTLLNAELFNFTTLSTIDECHFQDNHCIGNYSYLNILCMSFMIKLMFPFRFRCCRNTS